MALRFYRAIAYQAPGDGPADGWDVVLPDFPGCVTQGDTPQQAMENAIEALSLHVEGMVAEGLALPPTSPMNAPLPEWLSESDMPTQVHALLPTEVPGKNARVNVTLEQALLDRLDEAVRREGTTRSGYLAQAVQEKLQRSREVA
jgi:predicted RNase H-like HicB family nuclease